MNRREATVAAAAAACITAVQCCKHEATRGNGREKGKKTGDRKEERGQMCRYHMRTCMSCYYHAIE